MVKGKRKNPSNRNQDHSPSPERSTPTPPSPGHPNTTENLDPDLKTFLMMMIEDIKKDFHKSLKDLQESTAKKLQALKEKSFLPEHLPSIWKALDSIARSANTNN